MNIFTDHAFPWVAILLLVWWLWQEYHSREWWRKRSENLSSELEKMKAHYSSQIEKLNESRHQFIDAYVYEKSGWARPNYTDLLNVPFPMDIDNAYEEAYQQVYESLRALGIEGWCVRLYEESGGTFADGH